MTTINERKLCGNELQSLHANHDAAIAAALHLYFGMVHDIESLQLTIRQAEQRFSQWNSKVFGLNNDLKR
ncbi:MAG: hypothetical protein LBS16_02695 [Prevotellaceae bacterium]|jgi:hypothetical protein|nr:hypothetical protein [Prevotellaceae bacterium]